MPDDPRTHERVHLPEWRLLFSILFPVVFILSVILLEMSGALIFDYTFTSAVTVSLASFASGAILDYYNARKGRSALSGFPSGIPSICLTLLGIMLAAQYLVSLTGLKVYSLEGLLLFEAVYAAVMIVIVIRFPLVRKTGYRVNLHNPVRFNRNPDGSVSISGIGEEWPDGSEEAVRKFLSGEIDETGFFDLMGGRNRMTELLFSVAMKARDKTGVKTRDVWKPE